MEVCLDQCTTRGMPVIPVLLPGAPTQPKLPPFLKRLTWVDLREGMREQELKKLVWGITGTKPAGLSAGRRRTWSGGQHRGESRAAVENSSAVNRSTSHRT